MGTLIDYAEFLIEIRQYLKEFETCMNDRDFTQARLYAESALVETRLLCLTVKEMTQ